MKLITLDFETYYNKADFSLSKMTTESYVRDDRFQIIGVAVKVDDGETEWASGTHKEIKAWLESFPWEDSMLLAHNTMFDGLILSHQLGIYPKAYADTMCMARAIHGVHHSVSLASLSKRYKVGEKGTEVGDANGMRLEDFSPEALARYGDYCVNDVDLTYAIFNKMLRYGFPKLEMKLIDLTLRMFIQPKLDLNLNMLEQHLEEVRYRKFKLLTEANVTKEELGSNVKFAELLIQAGAVPPTKISPTTGYEVFAFAKSDEDFKALQDHPNLAVQALVSARLGIKSTLEESRTERLIGIAKRGLMPVPLQYYAAHTGRWGGADKVNLQNLPSRGDNAGKLKNAIEAPKGYRIIDADSSQIEARVLAWLSGQDDLVEAFAEGRDVYKIMASAIYGKPEEEITKQERFVGKTTILGCFGHDTKVLTSNGWKRIVEVQITDMVWDGEEWVKHYGVIPQGEKEVITARGLTATPDHEILTEHGWQEWSEVVTNPSLFQSAINKASLPLQDGSDIAEDIIRPYVALAGGKDGSIDTTSNPKKLPDAIHAEKSLVIRPAKSIGGTQILSQIGRIVNDFSTAYQAVSHAVIQKLVRFIPAMEVGVLPYMNLGAQTEEISYGTSYPLMNGTTQRETLTASTTAKDMNPVTYVLQPDPKTQEINVESRTCSQKLMTYDIAYAGPRNRYTVATDAGAIIAHNCGYGMGAVKFGAQLMAFGVPLEESEVKRIIQVYRATYPAIVDLWAQAQNALKALTQGATFDIGRKGVIRLAPKVKGIYLPSGLLMRYEELFAKSSAQGIKYLYKTRTGWSDIYGGKVIENVCQAIARCIIGEQMIKISKRYDVVLTVHDAIACIVKEDEVEEAQAFVEECMKWTPEWATGLPVSCESGYGVSYGDC